jgi:hypothetical protein
MIRTSFFSGTVALLLAVGCGDDDSAAGAGGAGAAAGAGGEGATTGPGGTPAQGTGGAGGEAGTTSEGGGGGGGAGEGGEGGGAPLPGDLVLRNAPELCGTFALIAPLPEEVGHLAAGRLTPTSYPFTVTEIGYELVGNLATCNNTLPHRTDIYVLSDETLPATPSSAATSVLSFDVDPGPTDETVRTVTLPLDQPIELTEGQHLAIAVEMVADGSTTACLNFCMDVAPVERSFWSNAVLEPYDWADMVSDFGFNGTYVVFASGPNPE